MPLIETARGPIWFADHRHDDANPILMLIHGAGVDHLDWPAELRRLKGVNIIAPDLPGHGKSPAPSRDKMADYAADLVALLDTLHLENALLAGHSMGGAIAQTIALEFPTRTRGLILLGTAAKFSVNDLILNGIVSDTEKTVDLIVKWQWAKPADPTKTFLSKQRLMSINPAVIHGDYIACNAFDVQDRLRQIRAPTLIIGGTEDKMSPHQLSEQLATGIPNAILVTLQGAGHMMMLERPEAVTNAIRAWISALMAG